MPGDDLARVIYIRWSDDGKHIRKWANEPFEGGEPMYSRSYLLSEERVEAAANGVCKQEGANWDAEHFGYTPNGESPDEMRDYFRDTARAALTAAIGEDG